MTGKSGSNLTNVPQCEAISKRSGKACRQPKVSGKRVCRFHGGLSTGPKTKEGKDRIRAAQLVHGRYSRNSEERRLAIRSYKELQKTIRLIKEFNKEESKRWERLEPYVEAYWQVQDKETFELVNLLIFGNLKQQIERNPTLRKLLRELLELLFKDSGLPAFEALLDNFDHSLRHRLNVPAEVWERLTPDEKSEEYITQFCQNLIDVQEALCTKS